MLRVVFLDHQRNLKVASLGSTVALECLGAINAFTPPSSSASSQIDAAVSSSSISGSSSGSSGGGAYDPRCLDFMLLSEFAAVAVFDNATLVHWNPTFPSPSPSSSSLSSSPAYASASAGQCTVGMVISAVKISPCYQCFTMSQACEAPSPSRPAAAAGGGAAGAYTYAIGMSTTSSAQPSLVLGVCGAGPGSRLGGILKLADLGQHVSSTASSSSSSSFSSSSCSSSSSSSTAFEHVSFSSMCTSTLHFYVADHGKDLHGYELAERGALSALDGIRRGMDIPLSSLLGGGGRGVGGWGVAADEEEPETAHENESTTAAVLVGSLLRASFTGTQEIAQAATATAMTVRDGEGSEVGALDPAVLSLSGVVPPVLMEGAEFEGLLIDSMHSLSSCLEVVAVVFAIIEFHSPQVDGFLMRIVSSAKVNLS